MKYVREDLAGRRFGMIFVVSFDPSSDPQGYGKWKCKCDCGTEFTQRGNRLLAGSAASCGCRKRDAKTESRISHGETRNGEVPRDYMVWQGMIARCENPKGNRWKSYGGKGVKVCERWRHSFPAFIEDMGPRPTPRHTIDRIDSSGNYEKSNCKWSTPKEQARHFAKNRMITAFGEIHCVAEWAELKSLPYAGFRARILRGWDAEEAMTTPFKITRSPENQKLTGLPNLATES